MKGHGQEQGEESAPPSRAGPAQTLLTQPPRPLRPYFSPNLLHSPS